MVVELKTDLARQRALAFVWAKGRLPNTREEFAEWLLEFDAHLVRIADAILQTHQDHLATCTREIAYTISLIPPRAAQD